MPLRGCTWCAEVWGADPGRGVPGQGRGWGAGAWGCRRHAQLPSRCLNPCRLRACVCVKKGGGRKWGGGGSGWQAGGGGLLAMGGRERDDSCFLFFLPAQSRLIFAKQYKFTDELPSQPSSPVMDLPGKKAVPLPAGCSFL